MTPPRALVFDLDGTLLDSREHLLRYMRELFAWLGRPYPAHQEPLFCTLDRLALEAAVFAPGEMDRVDAFRSAYPYHDRLGEIVPQPGAAALVERLRPLRLPRAILTNRGSSTGPLLERLGWRGVFSPVLSADVLDHPKPHPQGLLRIAQEFAVAPAELVYVGDAQIDVDCARAAGATAVRVGSDSAMDADVAVPDLPALAEWLTRIGLFPAAA